MQPETVGRVLLQGRLLVDSRKQAANVESHGTLVPRGAIEARRREAVTRIGRGKGYRGTNRKQRFRGCQNVPLQAYRLELDP